MLGVHAEFKGKHAGIPSGRNVQMWCKSQQPLSSHAAERSAGFALYNLVSQVVPKKKPAQDKRSLQAEKRAEQPVFSHFH